MTFSIPEDLARRLVQRVPARDRSRFLASVLEKSLSNEDEILKRSCLLASQDPDARRIEEEWDRIQDGVEEPWRDAPPR